MSTPADTPDAPSATSRRSADFGREGAPPAVRATGDGARGVAAFVYLAQRDAAGRVTGFRCELCSGSAARMARRPAAAVVGASLCDLWPELGDPETLSHLVEVVDRSEPWDTELTIPRAGVSCTLAVAAVAVGDFLITTVADVTTARRVAQAEREGEARLRAAMEATLDGFWLLDAVRDAQGHVIDMRVIDLNRRAQRQLGKPRGSLVGRLVSEILPLERGRTLVAGCAQVVERSAAVREDLAVVNAVGSVQWLERQLVPLTEDQVAVTTRDVTARRQGEAQLRRQLDSKAALIDAMQDGFVATDAEMVLTEVNQRFCELTGFTRAELIGGRPPFVFWPSDERVQGRARLTAVARDGVGEFDATFLTRYGVMLPVIVNGAALRDDRGEVVGYLATVKDVSERRRRADEIQRSFAAYEALAENSPDVIARFDRDLRHVYVNRAAELSIGIPRENIIGRTNRDLGQPHDVVTLWEAELAGVLERGDTHDVEIEVPSAHGTRWFHSRLVPEVDLDDRVRHVLSVSRDVTDRKHAELARAEGEAATRELARREAARRVVAEAVARTDSAEAICDVVAAQAAGLLRADAGWVVTREDLAPGRAVGSWSDPIGDRDAGGPARDDFGWRVSTPIVLRERVWGDLVVAGHAPQMPNHADEALAGFADLVSTALANAETRAELSRQARTDPLTGLMNRRALFERLEQLVQSARRFDEPLSVAVLDLDEFKRINDLHGHAAGDATLCEVHRRLLGVMRSDESVARIGGEEFAWVLPRTDLDQARAAVERGLAAISTDPIVTIGRLTCSAGLAQLAADEQPSDLLRRADRALYRAKAAGRNRVAAD